MKAVLNLRPPSEHRAEEEQAAVQTGGVEVLQHPRRLHRAHRRAGRRVPPHHRRPGQSPDVHPLHGRGQGGGVLDDPAVLRDGMTADAARRRGPQGWSGQRAASRGIRGEVHRLAPTEAGQTSVSSFLTVSSVSASSGFLSLRHRSIRGNRTAIPDRCRVERAIASNPSSKTWTGSTCRTGPKRSRVCRRIQRSSSRNLLVRQPRVRLGDRHELAGVPDAEGVVGQEARAPAAARLRVDQHGVDRVRIDLPLPPVAAPSSDAVRRRPALEHQALRRPALREFVRASVASSSQERGADDGRRAEHATVAVRRSRLEESTARRRAAGRGCRRRHARARRTP